MSFLRYARSGYRGETTIEVAPRETGNGTRGPSKGRLPVTAFFACAMTLGLAVGVVGALGEDDTEPPVPVNPVLAAPEQGEAPVRLATADGARKAVAPGGVAPAPAVIASPALPELVRVSVTDRVRRGETLSVALTRHGVTMEDVNLLVPSLKDTLDVRTIRPGDAYTVIEHQLRPAATVPSAAAPAVDGAVAATTAAPKAKRVRMDIFEFRPSASGAPTVIRATRGEKDGKPKYASIKHVTPVTTKIVAVTGEVKSSIYESMLGIGEGTDLVTRFANVFAWNIDFYRETQKGDVWKVLVEKRYAEGRFVGYGKVKAAEYINAGRTNRGFDFASTDGKVIGVFDTSGDSLEKTFLKNPLDIVRITSRYGQRFHPVLRRRASHNGVDYGASRGTPYFAVADGVVKEARYSRTAGKMIVLRHANGYTTQYFHSSRFATGIRPGAKVRQRQVIGYVGTTGRSTGPHLHFGMKKAGHYVDPKRQKFPAAKPIPSSYLEEFTAAVAPLLAELEALEMS